MRNRRVRKVWGRARVLVEGLESRVMLNGLTVIAHGLEFSNGMPTWEANMGSAVAKDAGTGTAIYRMTMGTDSSGAPAVTGFTLQSGVAVGSAGNVNGQAVLEIDWSADSHALGFFSAQYGTGKLGGLITNYLLANDAQLLEGAIHLIGHSRGASLMSVVAKDLGKSGIWVDQLTTLDPHPVSPDAAVSVGANVIFADDYYEHQDSTTRGSKVGGALDFGPLKLSGGYAGGVLGGFLPGAYHDNVYLYYYGTVNTGLGASADGQSIPNGWYATNGVVRGTTGFYYSAVEGGVRPTAGVGTLFGGKGGRSAVGKEVGTQWGDVGLLTPSVLTVAAGASFSTGYSYHSAGAGNSITFYLDTDQNPYDGNEAAVSAGVALTNSTASVRKGTASLAATVAAGSYFLEAKIVAGGVTRYAYGAGITVT